MTGGLGTEHWNSGALGTNGFHDSIAAVPQLGFYASDDPGVIAEQVSQMEEIGVTWILTDWWGWGDCEFARQEDDTWGECEYDNVVDDPGRQAIDKAHFALFEHLQRSDSPIKVALGLDNWMIHHEEWDDWEQGARKIGGNLSQEI